MLRSTDLGPCGNATGGGGRGQRRAVVIDAFLNAGERIYQDFDVFERFPIRTIVQMLRWAAYFVVGITILTMLPGKPAPVFFSGLGACAAVPLLIFKDTVLHFVAGVYLTANHMVRQGGRIEMPGHDTDGDVLDVSRTTVKAHNWNRTIATVPTYALPATGVALRPGEATS